MKAVSTREKKLLVAGGIAAVLYLFCNSLIFPYWDKLSEAAGSIDIQTKRLLNYQKILLGQDTVKAALNEAQRQVSTAEKGLLTSKTDSLAAAEFQGLVKQLSSAQALNVVRTEALPVKPVSPEYGKVAVRMEVSGSISSLVDFLASLDAGERIICVEEMRISPTHINAPKKKDVRVTMTLSALKNLEPSLALPAKKA